MNKILKTGIGVCMCLLLLGCSITAKEEFMKQANAEEIENAKTVYDISDLLKKTSAYMKYSECPSDDMITMYFEVLRPHDYIVVNTDNVDYILFLYEYAEYGETLSSINEIKKEYDASNPNHLKLTVEKQTEYTDNDGCAPDISYARCIVKADSDIKLLTVDGAAYNEYNGGIVNVSDHYGVADRDLNIIVPIKYETIRELDTFNTNKHYWFIALESGVGVMNESFETIIEPKYENIFFVSDKKFVVGKCPRDEVSLGNAQIGLLDQNGELIGDYIDGFIDGNESFNNDVHQAVFGRMSGEKFLKGVVDAQLNVIIEPEYKEISVFEVESKNDRFYVAENENGEFAVIDSSGNQQTKFEPSSVYDAQTKYYESLEK